MEQENKKLSSEQESSSEEQVSHPEQQTPEIMDDLRSPVESDEEIGPDELAVSAAGLTEISDADVDRIIAETLAETGAGTPEEIAKETTIPENSAAETEHQEPFRDEEYRDTFGEGEELESVFSSQPDPVSENSGKTEAPVRKRRPKHKSGYGLLGIPHILATVIWMIVVLAIGVSLGRMIWLSASDVLAFGRGDQEVTITITHEDDLTSIARKLEQSNLIRYPKLFKLFAELTGAMDKGKISAGTFTLNTLYDYNALINSMNTYSPLREEVKIMIPEGYTCAQIFQLMEEQGVCSVADLENYAANGELDDYWFLENVKRGDKNCLEGFLFPDTYQFYLNDDPERVLDKFLTNFDGRFNDKMRNDMETLNRELAQILASRGHDDAYIREHQINIQKITIIASLIEKETATVPEAYTISSVIYNRLYEEGGQHLLNIDAALIYALNGNIDPETGLTKPLTEADTKLDHPYNTYVHPGLTPGPISSPGLNSLNAALNPEDTDYYYYAFNPDTGVHSFFRTYQEHLNFLASLED